MSLIEIVVGIPVIGVIAGVAISSISNTKGSAKAGRDQGNAQTICTIYSGARVMGVTSTSNTQEGILDELIAGKTSPQTGLHFQLIALNPTQKAGTLSLLRMRRYRRNSLLFGRSRSRRGQPRLGGNDSSLTRRSITSW